VILAGNGHVRNKYGIPERLCRRVPEPYTVVCQDEDIEPGIADYVLITSEIKGRGIFQLGVAVAEENQKLIVRSVVDKSPAKRIGIRKGDVITAFAGRSVKAVVDIKMLYFFTDIRGDLIRRSFSQPFRFACGKSCCRGHLANKTCQYKGF
jgi:C-terminal processing protease CtpA/Prc